MAICNARMYYVVLKLPTRNNACILFGSHNDLVLMNDCCESIVISNASVRVEVE
jgi:hypothetical protein